MKLSTYLHRAGNGKEALAFYEQVGDGNVIFSMPFGGSPAEGTRAPRDDGAGADFWSPMFGMGRDRFETPWMVGATAQQR